MSFTGDHFSKQASDYSLYRPHYPEELFKYLASLTPEHELAWDCATGNGQAAIALSTFYKNVEATDASEKQIEQATPHNNIRYQVSEASQTPFANNSFDLITVAQALHWFDMDKFYKEVNRVAKPNGIFAAWCYSLFSINDELDPIIHHFYHETIGPYWPKERNYIDNKYETIPFPFESISTPGFSLTSQWNLQQVMGYMSTWSAVRYYREQQQIDPIPSLHQQLKQHWQDETIVKEIRWPIYLKVGRV